MPSFQPELSSLYNWNKYSSATQPALEYLASTGVGDFGVNFSVPQYYTELSSDTNEACPKSGLSYSDSVHPDPPQFHPELSSLYNWNGQQHSTALVTQGYMACARELEANNSVSQSCTQGALSPSITQGSVCKINSDSWDGLLDSVLVINSNDREARPEDVFTQAESSILEPHPSLDVACLLNITDGQEQYTATPLTS
ncbi:uncharacterized protein FOMMEDRAFT_150189 [Fomitiporia mediterranea MF3/22]|uniref:uncharacterized protein n=1 Tax=Fomitiporia mediterranea (strain MF3/22) TaxID=694068 RepID=UPI00044076C2|nr:uncharacterized protein FOMMEDRAFT_150189 [Fomitiporia mediterranea MF3/22]EJD07648.1 hypothetical protein FOMMEDRAFT_150189 [Fomitiporia mediterranea MF3/22]